MTARWLRHQVSRLAGALSRSATQRGQAVVEAAGAMTFVLLLLIGIIDFSPAVVWAVQLTHAAREGAAYARTSPTNTFEIRKRVVQSAPRVFGTMTDTQIAALTATDISVVCSTGLNGATKACSSAVGGDSVTITAARNYQTVTNLFATLLAAPLEISRSATSEIY